MSPHIITREYTVDLAPSTAAAVDIAPGVGFDMSDPLFPRVRVLRSFSDVTVPVGGKPAMDLISATASVVEVQNVAEEAQKLATSFSGNWGLVSGNAAYEKARNELSTRQIMYVTLFAGGQGESLASATWGTPPLAEGIADRDERLYQFLADHGSHYVTRVIRGARIEIRCARERTSSEDSVKFSASVRASAAAWSAKAEVSQEHRQYLSDAKTDVFCSVVCGNIEPLKYRFVIGWDGVWAFLKALQAGEVTVEPGPVRCELQNYFNTLLAFKQCRELFADRPTQPAPSPYGVPSGTILAWKPTMQNVEEVEGKARIVPPEGWLLCDGASGTPDLTDRFVRGASKFDQLSATGGIVWHDHTIAGQVGKAEWTDQRDTLAVPRDGNLMAYYEFTGEDQQPQKLGFGFRQHTHPFSGAQTSPASNLPPFVKLVYIMKK